MIQFDWGIWQVIVGIGRMLTASRTSRSSKRRLTTSKTEWSAVQQSSQSPSINTGRNLSDKCWQIVFYLTCPRVRSCKDSWPTIKNTRHFSLMHQKYRSIIYRSFSHIADSLKLEAHATCDTFHWSLLVRVCVNADNQVIDRRLYNTNVTIESHCDVWDEGMCHWTDRHEKQIDRNGTNRHSTTNWTDLIQQHPRSPPISISGQSRSIHLRPDPRWLRPTNHMSCGLEWQRIISSAIIVAILYSAIWTLILSQMHLATWQHNLNIQQLSSNDKDDSLVILSIKPMDFQVNNFH